MKLTMQLKSRSYDIILKAGCLANLHQFTNVENRRVFVLTDSGVPKQYAETVAAQCPRATIYTIPQGEGSKCLKVYGQVLQAMLEFGMDRKDLLVAVGGGVVGDLGGFCAASYMRGIDFVNCPTTTLAQVDSSIGGKTAIDLGETKNIVGAFWQPKVVLVDFDTLATLPRRQVVHDIQPQDLTDLCIKIFYIITVSLLSKSPEIIQILTYLRRCNTHFFTKIIGRDSLYIVFQKFTKVSIVTWQSLNHSF